MAVSEPSISPCLKSLPHLQRHTDNDSANLLEVVNTSAFLGAGDQQLFFEHVFELLFTVYLSRSRTVCSVSRSRPARAGNARRGQKIVFLLEVENRQSRVRHASRLLEILCVTPSFLQPPLFCQKAPTRQRSFIIQRHTPKCRRVVPANPPRRRRSVHRRSCMRRPWRRRADSMWSSHSSGPRLVARADRWSSRNRQMGR